MEKKELLSIIDKFASSGWDLIAQPSQYYLTSQNNKTALIEAVKQADIECGSCGCEYDSLYKRFLELSVLL